MLFPQNWLWISFGGIALILHSLTCPFTKAFFRTPLMLYIGRVSFGVCVPLPLQMRMLTNPFSV